MIITLTMNPAIDKTLTLDTFEPEKMNRTTHAVQDPGGKGVNVSKVIHALGGKSLATGIVGGASGDYIESSLKALGIDTCFVRVEGSTRTNMKIFCKDTQKTIEINEQGVTVDESVTSEVIKVLKSLCSEKSVLVIAGSVPAGVQTSFYKELIENLKEKGTKIIFDADGALFAEGIKAKPHVIKPNQKELEAYFGRSLADETALIEAGKSLLAEGIEHVILTLGSEGALYLNRQTILKANPLKVEAHSSVGAGDAFVGAVAYSMSQGLDTVEMLKLAVATSAGAVTTIGTNPVSRSWVDAHISEVCIQTLSV